MASIFATPVALVSLSYAEELWFKSVAGPFGSCLNRKASFCDQIHVSDSPEVVVLEDLSKDARFSAHPAVAGPPHLRFYAGAPLVGTTGHRYGTLCVLDTKPRSYPANLINTLVNFAEIATRELEQGNFETPTKIAQLGEVAQRTKDDYVEPIALLDLDIKGWPLLYSNKFWEQEINRGGSSGSSDGKTTACDRCSDDMGSFWDMFTCLDPEEVSRDVPAALQSRRPVKLRVQKKKVRGGVANGEQQQELRVVLRPASDILAANIPVGIPGFVPFNSKQSKGGDATSIDEGLPKSGNFWFATLHSAASSLPNSTTSTSTSSTAYKSAMSPPLSSGDTTPTSSAKHSGGSGSSSEESRRSSMDSQRRESFESERSTPRGVVDARSNKQPFAMPKKRLERQSAASRLSGISPKELLPYQMVLPERYKDLQLGPLLGSGAFARVHRALWRGAIVAVKLIEFPVDSSYWEDVERAVIEGALSVELHHPNIVQTIDFCRWRRAVQPDVSGALCDYAGEGYWSAPTEPLQEVDCVWIVQELCTGGKLGDALDRGWLRKWPAPEAPIDLVKYLHTAADIASALCFLHSKGITHGDLTYNNVLLTAPPFPPNTMSQNEGQSSEKQENEVNNATTDPRGFVAKLADFGLARVAQEGAMSTRHYGTISHMPPELLADGVLGLATDMYSLGVLFWEMYTGVRAWCGQRQDHIINAVCNGRGLKGLPENDMHAPEALKNLIARCLDTDRNKRPSAAVAWVEVQAMLLNCQVLTGDV
jgi:serine/threonine protein kinase